MTNRTKPIWVKHDWINLLLVVAFGCYGVGFIGVIAGVLAPNEIPPGFRILAFVMMVVIPFGVVAYLRRYPKEYIPAADTDTLLNVAGLLVTAGGFNLIPILNWATESAKTPDGWLTTSLPKPDLTWPNFFFTALALGLAVAALHRGLKDPTRALARLRRERQEFQQAKKDLLKIVKRGPGADDLAELNRLLDSIKDPKDPEELHGVLKNFLQTLPNGPGRRRAQRVTAP